MLPSEVMVTSGYMLLLKAMSESVVLWHLGSVLVSQASVTTKGHVDVPGLDCCLWHFAELVLPLAWAAQER